MKIKRVVDLSYHLSPEKEQRRLKITLNRSLESDYVNEYSFEAHAHIGTHVEGPFHCIQEGKTIDEVPLERFIGNAAVVRLDEKIIEERVITEGHVSSAGGHIVAGDIVLLATGFDDIFPAEGLQSEEYKAKSPYMTDEAIEWLVEKDIKMLGIDFWSTEEFPIDPAVGEEKHKILFRHDIPLIHSLVNLTTLEDDQIFFAALPLPIKGLDSSPVRATGVEFM